MRSLFTALLALLTLPALAQNTFSIRGRVTDKTTGETLPGATVQLSGNGQNTGTGADADGGYKLSNLPAGTYVVKATFVGYKPLTQNIKISSQSVVASFALTGDNASLAEVEVVATLAQERSTPVAFSAVNEVKLRETLSNRDLPLILNETPGVYATQGGGGTGDSRINVRGFDQRNVAVLINGVPVNDMETGNVFWSNWDLGDVTKSLQVQRGLSASKIAVPAVGGTINVLTRGFDDRRSALARLETGSNNYRKASLMLSSGTLKNDWAFTFYGSRRTSDGWVDHAYDDAFTYFGNISKRLGKHRLSLTALASPQSHGQRAFTQRVGLYSNDKATEIGAKTEATGDHGFSYNPYWGSFERYTPVRTITRNPTTGAIKTTISRTNLQGQENLNERANYYNKPQINLNDFWQVNDKLFLSAVVYASYGNGGGISGLTSGNSTTLPQGKDGQTDFQSVFNKNVNADTTVVNPDHKATAMLVNSVNSHRWYGFVLGGDYALNSQLTLSAGVDGRSYYGLHYRQIRDLLGADYAGYATSATARDNNDDPTRQLHVGDKIGYNYDGKTRWLGGYAQLEYKTPLLSAVVSGTMSEVGYKRIDYFAAKRVTVNGTDTAVPLFIQPVANGPFVPFSTVVNGQSYTNADGHYLETDWARYRGYSVKAGANYNLTEHDNVFINLGYNSKVPFFNQVYSTAGIAYPNVRNEGIKSIELGYGISYSSLKATLNAYYTLWTNKSTNSFNSAEQTYTTVRNVDARHAGIELGVAQEISRRVQLNAAISLGDWRWQGQGLRNTTDEAGFPKDGVAQNVPVYLDGVHVGDAAQNQFQLSMRIEPVKGAFIRPSFLLFTKYYAAFNPENISNPDTRADSYRLPTSRQFDLHLGYDLPTRLTGEHVRIGLKGSILNVLDEFYFTDVTNGSSTNSLDPNSLSVFFNRGRTFTVGLSATL